MDCHFINENLIKSMVEISLNQDLGTGDITADLIDANTRMTAKLITRENAVLCGQAWFEAVFKLLSDDIDIDWCFKDGDWLSEGDQILKISGPARVLLAGEREAMNWLQTLSGTATCAHHFVQAIGDHSVRLLDTRKTIPGLRLAQKYAVVVGGGHSHRLGLFDAFLIKENHIMSVGSISAAVKIARQNDPGKKVEVEVENQDQLAEAVAAKADVIMLDNYSIDEMKQAVTWVAGRVPLEVSGNVDIDSIADIASTGVDFISIGSLTKHVKAIDLSLRFTD
jgi:nicotinate-nucleotide pyrophosphorylase (carboxylating)